MENWLGTKGPKETGRSSFLINTKPAQAQIHVVKELLKQIDEVTTTIATLISERNASIFEHNTERQILTLSEDISTLYEFLKEVVGVNEGLQTQFLLEIGRTGRRVEKTLKKVSLSRGRFQRPFRD